MSNKKFKVGDRVKIIDCSSIESYELNKVGIIVEVEEFSDGWFSYVVDMGRPRRPNEISDNETRWWLREGMIELVNKPNVQLLFNFMY